MNGETTRGIKTFTMLSILLPVYNWDISLLVSALQQQALSLDFPFEIRCYDDGSELVFKHKNRPVSSLKNVVYRELDDNIGRAKIRNLLGRTAQYPYLLFLDADSGIINPDYLAIYLQHLQNTTVLYGGRGYAKNFFGPEGLKLHYKYGKKREEKPADYRKKRPYLSFLTNNFLIKKEIFLKVLFDENIKGYGHEDTLFGQELKKRGLEIAHIDNPLEHLGLEEKTVFLKKQEEAVRNLWHLSKRELKPETRLLKTFFWCKQKGLSGLILFLLNRLKPLIDYQLKSQNPLLLFLDLFKLQYLLKIDQYGTKHLPG